MERITFDRSIFLRTLGAFVVLFVLWTATCVSTDHFDRHGHISVLGFLTLFSGSIVFGPGLPWVRVLPLSLLVIGVFLVSTFVIAGPMMEMSGFGIAMPIVNALFLSAVMVKLMDKMKRIHFKAPAYILTFSSLLFAYFILNVAESVVPDPMLTMFNVFQLLLIVPLTLGVAFKRSLHTAAA